MTINSKKISVIGLGKLGACIAACLASKGFKVLGYDTNESVTLLLNGGIAPVVEPHLSELVLNSKKNLRATTHPEELIATTDITFIIVPTPSKKDGNFSDGYVKDVFTALAPSLKKKKTHHLFVLNSTVSPTTMDSSIIPHIEKISGKKLHRDFSVCYNPEFIALGDVVNGILNPDLVLIGESSVQAGNILEGIYKKLCSNKPYIARMSLVSAEIMKISLNSFITMKISFANMLGNICEEIPGADVDAITKAMGADKRVSPYYLKAGLPFGGPCFPRDNRAFQAFAKEKAGIGALLAQATDAAHDFQSDALYKKVIEVIKKNKHSTISIFGLAYKPKTGVIEESAAIKLIDTILKNHKNIKISVYDPLAVPNTEVIFKDKIHYASSLEKCLEKSSCWIIASPEKQFSDSIVYAKNKKGTIIDCWRVIDYTKLSKSIKYIPLGRRSHE